MQNSNYKLYLAPLQGFTKYCFRNAFITTGGLVDAAFAPYINVHNCTTKDFIDILPANNKGLLLIPQLLGNDASCIINTINQIKELGYKEVNLNLGCPYPMVTSKKLGAGLLPYPDKLHKILEQIFLNCTISVSVKMRLGFQDNHDWKELIPILNSFPLSEIIIHARNAKQLYKGIPDINSFKQAASLIKHPVCYNGDIFTLDQFHLITKELPTISRFMLGRGLISNPYLTQEIITCKEVSYYEKVERIDRIHDQLLYQNRLKNKDSCQAMNQTKIYWQYFSSTFRDKDKEIKNIKKASSMDEYNNACRKLFIANI